MNRHIDLRSDTFTMPDDGMRKAIYAAEVGNSAFGEDPSVRELEVEVSRYFEVEAAAFMPSATMAGQVAISVWGRPGDMAIIERFGHNFYFETGSMAVIAGVHATLLEGRHGILAPDDIAAAIVHPENPHARTAMIILENASNFGGGTVYPEKVLQSIFALAASHELPVHVDGARIWNAVVATQSRPTDLMPPGGSMSVCFSKGLGAPMGALLLGSDAFITEAQRVQSMLGGVMRQVGFMAAAALYGFRHNYERLAEDHANARLIAERIATNPAVEIDLESVQTNMLYFRPTGAPDAAERLVAALETDGIMAWNLGPLIRLVTSLNVTTEDCEYAAERINALLN